VFSINVEKVPYVQIELRGLFLVFVFYCCANRLTIHGTRGNPTILHGIDKAPTRKKGAPNIAKKFCKKAPILLGNIFFNPAPKAKSKNATMKMGMIEYANDQSSHISSSQLTFV